MKAQSLHGLITFFLLNLRGTSFGYAPSTSIPPVPNLEIQPGLSGETCSRVFFRLSCPAQFFPDHFLLGLR